MQSATVDDVENVQIAIAIINVSVASDSSIVCAPNPVQIYKVRTRLTFNLQTPGYVFPASNAIVVSNPGSDFPNPSNTVTSTQATLLDLNVEAGAFEYTVSVVEQASGKKISVDPTIENYPT